MERSCLLRNDFRGSAEDSQSGVFYMLPSTKAADQQGARSGYIVRDGSDIRTCLDCIS